MSAPCCDIREKFGHPAGEVLATDHWLVVVRPKQVTLGALVLVSRRHVLGLGDLRPDEAADLPLAAAALERRLAAAFGHDKINYLALMMLDPHLHFHVLPRYAAPRRFAGHEFVDTAWGGPPRLDVACPGPEVVEAVVATLRRAG